MDNKQFPYSAVISTMDCTTEDELINVRNTLINWCIENLGEVHQIWSWEWGDSSTIRFDILTFYFANQEDAVRFNLTHHA